MSSRISYSKNLGDFYEKVVSPMLFREVGWQWTCASSEQNWRDKYDYTITSLEGKVFLLEVKAPKKPPGRLLFEATGVAGYDGWGLGKADYILQWIDNREAIFYNRKSMLDTCLAIGGAIPLDPPRFTSGCFGPNGTWQGRSGVSTRTNKQNLDCFMLLSPGQARYCGYEKMRLR